MLFRRVDYASPVDNAPDWHLQHDGAPNRPCVVMLHGHGAHGDQLLTRPDLTRWLPELAALQINLLLPNLRDNAWMSPAAAADLAWLLSTVPQRRSKIVLWAGSMGGTGALIFAVLHPELVDALVVMGAATDLGRYRDWCGRQPAAIPAEIHRAIMAAYAGSSCRAHSAVDRADRLTMPIRFRHGGADPIIPVEQARALAKRLAGRTNFDYREIPDGGHDSPLAFGLEDLRDMLKKLERTQP